MGKIIFICVHKSYHDKMCLSLILQVNSEGSDLMQRLIWVFIVEYVPDMFLAQPFQEMAMIPV